MSAPERVRPPTVRPPTAQRRSSRLRAVLAAVIVLGPRHRRRVPRRSQVPGLAVDHRPGGDRDGLLHGCQPLHDARRHRSGRPSVAGRVHHGVGFERRALRRHPQQLELQLACDGRVPGGQRSEGIGVGRHPQDRGTCHPGLRSSSVQPGTASRTTSRSAACPPPAYRGTNRSATTRAGQDVQRLAHPGAARCAELRLLRRPADQRHDQHDRPARRLGHGHHAR